MIDPKTLLRCVFVVLQAALIYTALHMGGKTFAILLFGEALILAWALLDEAVREAGRNE